MYRFACSTVRSMGHDPVPPDAYAGSHWKAAPPSRAWTGLPAALPAMSQSAISTAPSTDMPMPVRAHHSDRWASSSKQRSGCVGSRARSRSTSASRKPSTSGGTTSDRK